MKNISRQIVSLAVLIGILFLFLVQENGYKVRGNPISTAYPPPDLMSIKKQPEVYAYPPPSLSQDVMEFIFPANHVQQKNHSDITSKLKTIVMPNDRIVAITNNGDIKDVNLSYLDNPSQINPLLDTIFSNPLFRNL